MLKKLFKIIYITVYLIAVGIITKEMSNYGFLISKGSGYMLGIFGATIGFIVINRFDKELENFIKKFGSKEED